MFCVSCVLCCVIFSGHGPATQRGFGSPKKSRLLVGLVGTGSHRQVCGAPYLPLLPCFVSRLEKEDVVAVGWYFPSFYPFACVNFVAILLCGQFWSHPAFEDCCVAPSCTHVMHQRRSTRGPLHVMHIFHVVLCCYATTFVLDPGLKNGAAAGPKRVPIGEFSLGAMRPDVRYRCGARDGMRRLPNQTTNKCVQMLHLPVNCSTIMSSTAPATSLFCRHHCFFISLDECYFFCHKR